MNVLAPNTSVGPCTFQDSALGGRLALKSHLDVQLYK